MRRRELVLSIVEDNLAPPTRFDLSFRLGDIPVRVHPFFWLTTILLGLNTGREGLDILIYLSVWTGVVFVSILAHELGHVLMGRSFGSRGHIILTGFCGLAVGSSNVPRRWQRNAVFFSRAWRRLPARRFGHGHWLALQSGGNAFPARPAHSRAGCGRPRR
jgi:hypothetical protein